MKDRKLEEKLQNALKQGVQPIRLNETIQLCTKIMWEQCICREEPRTGFWRFLSDVFRFEGIRMRGV